MMIDPLSSFVADRAGELSLLQFMKGMDSASQTDHLLKVAAVRESGPAVTNDEQASSFLIAWPFYLTPVHLSPAWSA